MKTDLEISEVANYIDSTRSSFEHSLKELVDIPSVSMDPNHKSDITRTAETAKKLLTESGIKAEIISTRGNPIVYGELISNPDNPCVLIYNHLDVQPADPTDWQTPPFVMAVENGTYKGRGTTDDKGPALTVMYAAKYIAQHHIPINLKFVWELEEEIGSPSFEDFLKKNKERLTTNSVVVSDTIWVSREQPAIPYGLRGLQGLLIRLKTGAKDVHSGLTGGLARNPIGELAQLISECYDARTGQVTIPKFYDDVVAPTADERNSFVRSGFTVEKFMKAHDLNSVRTLNAEEGSMRIWAQPTFEVHGIVGGYTGPGVKTIVPHLAEAKITMRLVPKQDPQKILALVTEFVKQKCPDAEIIPEGTLHPYLGETSGPYSQAATMAMRDAFGKEPAFTREGGSIGAVLSMSQILKAPIVFLGLSLPEHGYHAVNENFDWQQAKGGMKMFISYFRSLSKIK